MSVIYPLAKQGLLSGAWNLTTDNLYCALVDTGTYSYNAAHQFWSTVQPSAVGPQLALTTKTVNVPNPGVFDADDLLFQALTGASFEAIVIYKNTGTPATSPLLAYLDGLSVLPQGNDVVVVWDQGPYRIFSL